MNALLLTELEHGIVRIQRILDGRESGDIEGLFQELLDRAAAAAGRESPEYGLTLRARASYYRNRGEAARAVEEYTRALAFLERAGDEGLIQVVQTITSIAALQAQLGEAIKAQQSARRVIELIEEYARDPDRYAPPVPSRQGPPDHEDDGDDASPPSSPDMAGMLARGVADALAAGTPPESLWVFDELAKSAAGKPVMQLAILLSRAAFEGALGNLAAQETCARAWALAYASTKASDFPLPGQWVQLGDLALHCGRPHDALEAARRLRDLQPRNDDAQLLSNRYAALHLEAAVWNSGNDPDTAEQSLRRLLDFCASSLGRDAERTIDAETQLGRFLINRGRPGEAVEMLKHAAKVRVASPAHPDAQSAASLFNVALCLDKYGDDTEAMNYYAMAYRIYAFVLGPSHPNTASSALNLAETARVAHDYETAERWFRITLDAERESQGQRTARVAHALNNLAETLMATGRADEAAPLAEDALDIRKELFGKLSAEYARSLAVMARVALKRGDRERLDAAMAEFKTDSSSGRVALPIDLGVDYLELRGDYEQAIEGCEQAVAQLDKAEHQGGDSLLPNQGITVRFKLGELFAHVGRWTEAKHRLLRAFEIESIFLSDEAGRRSQRQIRLMLGESRARIATLLDALTRDPDVTPEDVRAAYDVIQQRKGMETRLLRLQKPSFIGDRALTSASPDRLEEVRADVEGIVESLRTARQEWLAALLRQAQQAGPDPQGLSLVARQDQVELLERRLASFVGGGSRDWELLGTTSHTPHVSDGTAVVEYFFTETSAPVYYVFVVTHETIHLVSLGDAASIHQALTQLRTQVVDAPPQPDDPDPAWRRRARFLANRLLKPLLSLLQDTERLYIVPDAELFTLPFDLLPLDDGRLAIDRWTITHLWNGGELAAFNLTLGSPAMPGQSVVVSAPALGAGDAPYKWRFAALPFADREGEAVAGKIGAIHLQGSAATKRAVIGSGSAEILHFATHSFYVARAQAGVTAPPAGPDTLLFRARSVLADPMQRSGIALAGADLELNAPTAASPGVLFASEVLDLDLRSTDLTVLSSCQSGIGDPHPGDGIQGLRRAFRAAGASTVVSSLWKVPDEATHDFMMAFYDRLVNQVPRGQAFHEAKLALRQRYSNDPLLWAGFVLDGSDQPLFRFNAMRGLKVATLSGIGLSFDSAMEHIANERWDEAIQSLELVRHSQTADDELRAAAGYEHAGVLRRTGRFEEALAVYDALIGDIHTPPEKQRFAVADRALTRQLLGDFEGAYLDYTSILTSASLPDEMRAKLLVNRGHLQSTQSNPEMAIADWSEVLSNPRSPQDQRLMALLNRADQYRRMKNYPEAIADATALAEMPESEGSPGRGKAYLVLALCRSEQGKLPAAIVAVRRHFKERVTPAPPGAAKELAACKTSAQLTKLIASLV